MSKVDIKSIIAWHAKRYECFGVRDLFKLLYQSAHGCEHLVSSFERATEMIKEEHSAEGSADDSIVPLGGDFSRVSLSALDGGLSPETLARLFVLSAEKKGEGREALSSGISFARELASEGVFSFSSEELEIGLSFWERDGYPAVRHSDEYRAHHRPAYRVIADKYARLLPLFSMIDSSLSANGRAVLAIEGGSAGGKTTLSAILAGVYGAAIIHADDFFLRPEQRTPERFSEVGGNLDRERLLSEVLLPLSRGEAFSYRPFDCSLGRLTAPVDVASTPLTVVEGAYSMHPELRAYYTLSVFLSVSDELQRERIPRRNSPAIAERYFAEWIPLEKRYFDLTGVKDTCSLILDAADIAAL